VSEKKIFAIKIAQKVKHTSDTPCVCFSESLCF